MLQAVDDPTDELALVSALRSPIFGCGDDDLYTFRAEHGGRWDHQAALPESLPPGHPVVALESSVDTAPPGLAMVPFV